MIRRFLNVSGLLIAAGILSACGGVSSDESQPPVTDPTGGAFKATYKPSFALIPFPNDIYFSGSTDGTLNIPASSSNPALGALNELDGYSTNAKIYADMTDVVDADTVIYGATVFLIDTSTLTPVAATASTAGYANGQSVIEITPVAPLKPATTYAAFITKNVASSTGDNLGTDDVFQALVNAYAADTPAGTNLGDATSTALYAAVQPLLALAEGAGFGGADAANIAVAWSFKTQSIGQSLAVINATAAAQTSGFVPVLKDPNNPGLGIATPADLVGNPAAGSNANVFIGMIEVPYYTTNPLTGHWVPEAAPCQAVVDAVEALSTQPASTTSACPTPAVQNTYKVPVLLTVPNGGPTNGVTIFQHGITGNRTNMLAIAGALAAAGQATIAIDLPLHGITDTASPLYAGNLQTYFEGLTEQTFDIDANDDDVIDSSGANFINLASLLTTRDSLRQAAANLIYLARTIPAMDYNVALDPGLAGADFAGLPISFAGMSLGAITGTTFLASNNDVGAAVLSVPGGNLSHLLSTSNTFGPVINEGLAANGIIEGTRMYAEFLRNAQTVVDGGDPINYGAAAAANHGILVHEVVGGAGSLPDQVIPNSATEALAAVMGLTAADADIVAGTPQHLLVQFTAGSHSSLLDPSASPQATGEMQKQAATFVASFGTMLDTTDSSVIKPQP